MDILLDIIVWTVALSGVTILVVLLMLMLAIKKDLW